jgi:hypothetical protein
MAMKKVVYTAVTDGYDLYPVINRNDGWDFVCFAESPLRSEGWDIELIDRKDMLVDNELMPDDKAKTTKRIKILPHVFLRDYDVSIWIDSSLQFKSAINLDDLTLDFIQSDKLMRVRTHPYRRCIYREAEEVAKMGLDTRRSVDSLMAKYRSEKFPEGFGLIEANFLLRKHNADPLVAFSEAWWANVRDFSRRDQLSFDYVRWKRPIDIDFIDDRVKPGVEVLSRGRDRGPFFNSTFYYYPTRI